MRKCREREANTISKPTGFTIECPVHFKNMRKGRKRLQEGTTPENLMVEKGKIPRVSRLMALAIHFDELIRLGRIRDCADISRLGHITRARVTQIMNLLNLAPDIIEDILFLPRIHKGRDSICERDLRPIAAAVEWEEQRRMWKSLSKILTSI